MTKEENQFIEDFKEVYYDFEMFSTSGNKEVKKLIIEATKTIFEEEIVDRKGINDYLKRLINESYNGKDGFREIRDTEPETHIQNHINKALKFKGYRFKVNRFEF